MTFSLQLFMFYGGPFDTNIFFSLKYLVQHHRDVSEKLFSADKSFIGSKRREYKALPLCRQSYLSSSLRL